MKGTVTSMREQCIMTCTGTITTKINEKIHAFFTLKLNGCDGWYSSCPAASSEWIGDGLGLRVILHVIKPKMTLAGIKPQQSSLQSANYFH
jgi:hypothetical protein